MAEISAGNDHYPVGTLAGLKACADRIAQLADELEDERERRNDLIVSLVDQGVPRRQICEAGRVSPKTVCFCLAEAG